LAFVHSNLTNVMHLTEASGPTKDPRGIIVPPEAWHRMQQVQMQLATGLNQVNDPS
jgi:hypothetical protein